MIIIAKILGSVNVMGVIMSLLDTLTSALLKGDFATIRSILEIIVSTIRDMLPKIRRGRFREMMSKVTTEVTQLLNKLTNGAYDDVSKFVSNMKERLKQRVAARAREALS